MEKYCPKCFVRFPKEQIRCPEDGTELIPVPSGTLVGQELDGRYRILELLGKGGMGVVYVAEQNVIGRRVALKVLKRALAEDDASVKRFLIEAKAIANLRNQHTITLYDFGVTSDGLLYYTMELLKGQSVSQLIKKKGPLHWKRAADIMFQVLDSLEEAHNQQILHRDLKPDNLQINVVDGEDDITVLDFGIAKLAGDQSMGTVTKTGMICGTPHYLSPEQVMGNKALPASDLYALAIVLYEMLAGRPPFHETTPMKLLLKQLNETPKTVTERNPHVQIPQSLEEFLKKALLKDPEQRLPDVPAFREGLQKAVAEAEGSSDTVNLPAMETTSDGLRSLKDDFSSLTTLPGQVDANDSEPDIAPIIPATQTRKPLWVAIASVGIGAIVALFIWAPWSGSKSAAESAEDLSPAVAQSQDISSQRPETADVLSQMHTISVPVTQPTPSDVVEQADLPEDISPDLPALPDLKEMVDVTSELPADSLVEIADSTSELVDDTTTDQGSEVQGDVSLDTTDARSHDIASDTTSVEVKAKLTPEPKKRTYRPRRHQHTPRKSIGGSTSRGTKGDRKTATKGNDNGETKTPEETKSGLKFKGLDDEPKDKKEEKKEGGLKFKTLD